MNDSFEFILHSPLTKEDWNRISDVEHENTKSVTFQTPQGRQVRYIKYEVLDKIRAEIDGLVYYWCEVNPRSVIGDVLKIIDKYRVESEVEE